MSISAKDVMNLRNKTGLAMMECKKALQEANGNVDEAETLTFSSGSPFGKMGIAPPFMSNKNVDFSSIFPLSIIEMPTEWQTINLPFSGSSTRL